MTFTVNVDEKKPGVLIVSLAGSLDTNTYTQLDQEMVLLLQREPTLVVIDMEFLNYISSIGISSILKAKKELKKQGAELSLMNLQPQIRKVFDIINALPSQPIFSSTEELDRYLLQMQRETIAGQTE